MKLRKALHKELPLVWEMMQYAIARRKEDGSTQWQDGYPNEQAIGNDIEKGNAWVLEDNDDLLLYAAIIFDGEPAYNDIHGKWLSNQRYVVLHRVAAAPAAKGRNAGTRLFELVEDVCRQNNVFSIKVDTNFDNLSMLRILDTMGYTYCGEVFFRGAARRAYEKVLPAAKE